MTMENNTPLTPEVIKKAAEESATQSFEPNTKEWAMSGNQFMVGAQYVLQRTAALQSKIAELERESASLNKFLDEATENHHKLMGLLEIEIKACAERWEKDPIVFWQSYCKEHGITPKTDTDGK